MEVRATMYDHRHPEAFRLHELCDMKKGALSVRTTQGDRFIFKVQSNTYRSLILEVINQSLPYPMELHTNRLIGKSFVRVHTTNWSVVDIPCIDDAYLMNHFLHVVRLLETQTQIQTETTIEYTLQRSFYKARYACSFAYA